MLTLDAASYPHILDEVVDCVHDAQTVKALRLVSAATRRRIDRRLQRHLLVRYDGVRSRVGGVRGADWFAGGELNAAMGQRRRASASFPGRSWQKAGNRERKDTLTPTPDGPAPTYVDVDARMTILGASTSKLVHDFEAVQQTLSSYVSPDSGNGSTNTGTGTGARIVRGRMTELYPQSDVPARCVVLFFDTYPLALYHTVAHLQDPFAEEAVYHVRYDPAFRAVDTARVQSVSTITAFPKRSTFLFSPVASGRTGHSPNCQQCAGANAGAAGSGVRILDHVLSHIVPDWIFNQGHTYRFVGTEGWSRDWISSELVAPSGAVWAAAPPMGSVKDAILWMLGELARHANGMYDAGADGRELGLRLENAVSFLTLEEYERELGPEDFAVVTAAPGVEYELDAAAQSRPNGHSRPVWPR